MSLATSSTSQFRRLANLQPLDTLWPACASQIPASLTWSQLVSSTFDRFRRVSANMKMTISVPWPSLSQFTSPPSLLNVLALGWSLHHMRLQATTIVVCILHVRCEKVLCVSLYQLCHMPLIHILHSSEPQVCCMQVCLDVALSRPTSQQPQSRECDFSPLHLPPHPQSPRQELA